MCITSFVKLRQRLDENSRYQVISKLLPQFDGKYIYVKHDSEAFLADCRDRAIRISHVGHITFIGKSSRVCFTTTNTPYFLDDLINVTILFEV
jgi:hypothetical protein